MTQKDKEFCIPDRISVKIGHGGLRYFELRFNGAEAQFYLHGAHVLHYQPAEQRPILWQSKESWFEPGNPIRGGIPVCWPWFGAHPTDPDQPSHGFVRLTEWEPVSSSATEEATIVILQFPVTKCPPGISLQLKVKLSEQLSVLLTTTNNSGIDFKFTEALHSYFSIADIHKVTVSGLEGRHYIDSLSPGLSHQQQNGTITFSAETDRIYLNTPDTCTIIDKAIKRSIHIKKENSLSTVVWNPWIDKSIRMPDFGDREFLKMVCVETANCGPNPIILPPGRIHALRLDIHIENKMKQKIV